MEAILQLGTEHVNPALSDAALGVMNFLNQVAMQFPQAISFAPGRPPEEHFAIGATLPYIERFVREGDLTQLHKAERHGIDSLGQYGRTNGVIGGLIARLLRHDENILASANDIVVTVGAQEAMCLCLLTLCGRPGDVALTVDPAYIGMSGAAKLLGIDVVGVPCSDTGIDLHALGKTVQDLARLGRRARVLYLCSDHANPTGLTLGLPERRRLLQAAHELDLLLIEDGAYSYFCYDTEPLPPLKSLEGGERVIYLGSFAKTVFPGLRMGYAVAGQRVAVAAGAFTSLADEMSKAKSLLSVNTPALMQAVVGGLLLAQDCSLRDYVQPRLRAIRASRDAMLAALDKYAPRHSDGSRPITWTRPSGGFFLTVTMPRPIGNAELLDCAKRYGVTWTPMSYFLLDQSPSCQLRLSFSFVTPDEVAEGIRRLAAWMHDFIDL